MGRTEDYMIEEIIDRELVTVYFQPLVFIRKKEVAGYRAVCRGNTPGGVIITEGDMFMAAENYGLLLQADRLLRKKSLESFLRYFNSGSILLALNLNCSVIKNGFGPKNLLRAVESYGIDPSRIILEITGSEPDCGSLPPDSITQYRRYGFIVSMEGFTAGVTGRDRVMILRPDMIRLGRNIVRGIGTDPLRQEVAGSLVNLARKTGALVMADGVDDEEDALKMMELDTDILRGEYFVSVSVPGGCHADEIRERINMLSRAFLKTSIERSDRDSRKNVQSMRILDGIVCDITRSGAHAPDDVIKNVIKKYDGIECVYILDENGIQVTDTFVNTDIGNLDRGRIINPDRINSDHSNKSCYYKLLCGEKYYISRPYISPVTGNMCITASRMFSGSDGAGRILCVDMSAR